MSLHSKRAAVVFAVVWAVGSGWAVPASAGTITVFSTGVDASGKPLPGGSLDPHYTIDAAAAAAGGSGPWVINNATAESVFWVDDTATSSWISSKQDTHEAPNTTYSTTFSLAGLDPHSAVLTGRLAADDATTVYLNGVEVFYDPPAPQPWLTLVPFTISSNFDAGLNTLEFVTPNDIANSPNLDGPGGLQVDISGTASASSHTPGVVPVPAAFVVWSIVFGTMGVFMTLPAPARQAGTQVRAMRLS